MDPVINDRQLRSVMLLDPPKRYSYFVKKVADWETVGGLYFKGWALTETPQGRTVFPLWPAKEFARVVAREEWEDYHPESISLNEFIHDLLPKLDSDGILPGVFWVPKVGSVNTSVQQLISDLKTEIGRIE